MGKVKKDKLSKGLDMSMSKTEVSKKRRNGEKKKTLSEEGARKYGYISANSVITMAESAGFCNIQEEVAKNLAEDVTYRLRYIIQQCKKYMTHSRHKKLCCADINEVLKMCDASPVYGHTADSLSDGFIFVKEADVFLLEDNMIDLPSYALTEVSVQQKHPTSVTATWMKAEDNKVKTEGRSKGEETKCNSTEPRSSENLKLVNSVPSHVEYQRLSTDNSDSETKIATNLIKYYGITCNTILGHSDLKVVFQDLSSNSKILPVIPYLLNFITITLNKLTSARQIKRLLQTVEALSKNSSIDFGPYWATSRVINAMLMIIAVDKKPAKVSYDYHLREYAAQVLSKVLTMWCSRDEQRATVIKKMGKLLRDFKLSAKVHYGALVLLTALGPEALKVSFWGILDQYLSFLQEIKKGLEPKVSPDVAMLEQVILSAAVLFYRFHHLQEEDERFSVPLLDHYLYSYFGDASCSLRLNLLENSKFLSILQDTSTPVRETHIQRPSRMLKYMSTRYKPDTKRLTVENVFNVPKVRRKKNSRIIFKFAGAIPVPEVSLKRRRFDSRYSQFIAGKESEGHVVVVGKFWRKSRHYHCTNSRVPIGNIFSTL